MKEQLTFGDTIALDMLPTSLYKELRYEVLGPFLRRHELFNCWVITHKSVAKQFSVDGVEICFLKPGDELFRADMDSEHAYFFSSGTLGYSKLSNEVAPETILVPVETWLSEASLWSHWRHLGSCEAQARCKIAVTSYDRLAHHARGNRLIRTITASYCKFFCRALANPPAKELADDIFVPLTKFAVLLTQFPDDLRTIIATRAINVSKLKLGKRSAGKLAAEVEEGKCVVYINSEGECERTVLVTVMVLQDDDGHVLHEIGKVVPTIDIRRDGVERRRWEAEAGFKLPGLKQDRGESYENTLKRLVCNKMKVLTDKYEHVNTVSEEMVAFSAEFGVKTRYYRTKLLCTIRGEFPARVVTQDIHSSNYMHKSHTSASNLDLACPPLSLYVIFEDEVARIYAWLPQEFANELNLMAPHRRDQALNKMLNSIDLNLIEECLIDELRRQYSLDRIAM